MSNNFETLASINVNDKVEKKGNLSYLSWAWAVDQVMRKDPTANWSFREPMVFQDGTMMVHCDVTVFGKTMYMFLPVMDHRNKAIQNPNAFDINKNMMRCLAKGFAVHGLGLYIYAGEDLPELDTETKTKQLTDGFNRALTDIENATDPKQLGAIYRHFEGTEFQEQIKDACAKRKAQLTA